MLKRIVLPLMLIIASQSFADSESVRLEGNDIPYKRAVYQSVVLGTNTSGGLVMSSAGVSIPDEITKITDQDIKKIRSIGDQFCGNLGDADLKLWFAIGAKGEVYVVEGSFQAGIEVTFHCKNKDPKH